MQPLLIQKRHIKLIDHYQMFKVRTPEKIQSFMKAKIFYNFKKTRVKDKLKIKATSRYIMIQNMTMSKSIIMMKKMIIKINLKHLICRINLLFQK